MQKKKKLSKFKVCFVTIYGDSSCINVKAKNKVKAKSIARKKAPLWKKGTVIKKIG